jgi:hypothetical protein
MRGGEGFWNPGIAPIQPKLLLVGRNPVCTDAIATRVMGFDPTAAAGQFPFQGENHLRLLAQAGVGTHDPARIEVRGLSCKEALVPYRLGRATIGPPSSICPLAARRASYDFRTG